MNSFKSTSKFKVNEAASWLLVIILATITLRTLSFLFIPFCVAILFCYALGIPLDFLKLFDLPRFVRNLLVLALGHPRYAPFRPTH